LFQCSRATAAAALFFRKHPFMPVNPFLSVRQNFKTPAGDRLAFNIEALGASVRLLPYSIKVLLESCVRNCDGYVYTETAVRALMNYDAKAVGEQEIAFMPGRVVLQDFTGVPCVVDWPRCGPRWNGWARTLRK